MNLKKYFFVASVFIVVITLAFFCEDDPIGQCMIDLDDRSTQAYEYCIEVTK